MMLEQSLISPNFLGKESFRWFIGVTTKHYSIQGVGDSGYKVKVRIIGYHPDSSDVLSDEELPWAQVLVPLSSGTGNWGDASYQIPAGGTTVVGFFLDGDNGQQPVILGGLFAGYGIEHPNDWDKGTNGFNPFKRNKVAFSSIVKSSSDGKSTYPNGATHIVNPAGNVGMGSTSQGKPSQGKDKCNVGDRNQFIVSIPTTCKEATSTYSSVLYAIRRFIQGLNTINQVTGLVNTVTNQVANIDGLVSEATTALSDLFSEYVKKIRDDINKDIYRALEKFLNSILPKSVKLFKQIAVDQIVEEIWCAFDKIIKALAEFFTSFLMQLIDTVISIPLCAAESLVGSVLSSVSAQISEAIGPALDQLSSVIGGVIGPISSYVSQALTYANAALNFLSCESAECKQQFDYKMNVGYIPKETIDNVNTVVNYPSQGIQSGKQAAEQWLGINNPVQQDLPPELAGTLGGCDVTSLECGLPTVTFFGGGGVGAAGLAVVDSIGQVAGINMTDFGAGYSGAPYVSIEDPCNTGSGARGTAVISDGQVVGVTITNPGYGYLNSTTYTGSTSDPCSTPLIDSSGQEVVGSIAKINIIKPGIGYTTGDTIIDEACPINDIEIYPVVDSSGKIIDFNIVNPGTAIRVFPQLEINSLDGEGAIIQPTLTFKPVQPVGIETNPVKIRKVVLCAENHDL